MANHKFTADVKAAFLEALGTGVGDGVVSRSNYLRAVCEKVGISHTTYYRHMRKYRALVERGEPFTDTERELVDFGHQVDALVRQLRNKRGRWNLRAAQKILGKIFADDAKYEREYYRSKQTQRQRATQRKKEKKLKIVEQQTDQLTQGIGYFEFKSETSQKNM